MSFEILSGSAEGFLQPIVFFKMSSSERVKVVLTSEIYHMLIYSLLWEICGLNFYIIQISGPMITTYKRLYIATRNGILNRYREKNSDTHT